ncbi:hypothetical protein VU06_03240 [Desulfobulbus sp. F3]|nr:hypothetical protein [Desulfobulbus sp. F3]
MIFSLLWIKDGFGCLVYSAGIQEPIAALFPKKKGGGAEVACGYNGRDVLTHLLAGTLIEMITVKTGKQKRSTQKPLIITAGKGCDSDPTRSLFNKKQRPSTANSKKRRGRPFSMTANLLDLKSNSIFHGCKENFIGSPMGKIAKIFPTSFSLVVCFM